MTHRQAPPRRAALAFVFVTVVLDALGAGICIPVLPGLLKSFLGGDTAHAAMAFGIFATAWAMMQFLCSPLLGALSDRFGRRPVILISCFGMGLDYLIMALAPNLAWLFLARLASGISAATVSTAYAYVADVTPAEQRAAGFGKLGVACGLGFVLGPALGGVLGGVDPHLPFWAAAIMAVINALYGYFVLPESLAPSRRSGFSWARASPVGSLMLLRAHPKLGGYIGVSFLLNLAEQALPSTTVLYVGYRYGWDAAAIGWMLAAVGVLGILVQGGLTRRIVARYDERPTLIAALFCGASGMCIYGLASSTAVFWLGVPVMSLCGLAAPAVQGLMSSRVGPYDQGRLQACNASASGIAGMLGPTLFTQTFAYFIAQGKAQYLSGAPFLLASAILLAAMVYAWRLRR